MIRSDGRRRAVAILLAFVTLTSSITAGVVFAAEPAAAHGDHADGGGSDGSNSWAVDSDSFRKETVVGGLEQPMETVFLPDGRMLIIQKGGEILIYDPSTEAGPETYLDLNETDDIESDRERGLLGIALANDFEDSGEFFVYYTRLDEPNATSEADSEPENVLAKFAHVENGGGTASYADPDSREVLWRNEIHTGSKIACCHLGGGLDVGPDGKVYVATGDEYDHAEWAQDLSRPDGKIIRLNPDGSVPSDNPFANDGKPEETLDEIWAYGLRNPYRINFAQNGELYIGEVGGNNRYNATEDIHIGEKGANYGWPDCEGECENPDYSDPIYAYKHGETPGGANDDPEGDGYGAAVTVGPVYGADMFPEEYDNVLFYSDYNDRLIKYLVLNEAGTEVVAGPYNFDDRAGALVSMKVGPDGALYGSQLGRGRIVRYVYESGDKAPQIESTAATPRSGEAPLDVTFSASASDPEGDDVSYTWHFGDGETATGAEVTHTYGESGSYDAYVEVSDGTTSVDSESATVSVGGAPEITITSSSEDLTARAGEEITLTADATDPEDGRLSGDAISWDIKLAHNTHRHPQTSATGESITYEVPTKGHATTGVVAYEVSVTATDSNGLQTEKSVTIRPDEVDITLKSQPEGIRLSVEGKPQSTDGGYTFDTMIGYEHGVTAPQSVCRQGARYVFDGWSDGNTDNERTYVVPPADETLTAQYRQAGTCGDIPEDGLVGRYEADTGVQTDGDGVTGWSDASGNGNDLAADGAPQLNANAANGSGAVSFDGDDDLMSADDLSGFPTGAGDRTMFVVADYVDNDGGFGGVAYGSGSANDAFGLVVDSAGELTVQGFGGANDQHSGAQGVGAGRIAQSVVYEDGRYVHYRNGQQIDSGEHDFTTTRERLVVGGEITPPPHTEMNVSAVLVYDRALSEEERREVQTYLERKYGVTDETGGTGGDDDGGDGDTDGNETNAPPTVEDTAITYDGTPNTFDATRFATDGDGVDASSLRIVDRATNGDAEAHDNGSITYVSDATTGSDSFTFAFSDARGAESEPATVDVTILAGGADGNETSDGGGNGTNAPPTANDDNPDSIEVGGSVTVPVLDNDEAVDGELDASSVTVVDAPDEGSATVNDDGSVAYTHMGGDATTDAFTYTVADGDGAVSNEATVTLNVESPPDAGEDDSAGSGGGSGDGDSDSGGSDDGGNDSSSDDGSSDDDNDASRSSGSSGGYGGSVEETAEFELSNATLSAANATVGDAVNVSAIVDNVGEADGTTTVTLIADDNAVDSRELSLEAGANATVTFSHAFEESGTYALYLDGRSLGNVTVSDAAQANGNGTTDDAGTGTATAASDAGETETGTTAPADDPTDTATQAGGQTDADGETNSGTPGFGPVVALVALLSLAAVARVRRRN